ncbi:MAG: ribbon-helix-helix protein, CopG family [Deltaproteobacteria bacterium]|nr:ribbon-helix-helix protein, CopG family [Deltaproteobacteria bacterium]
MAKVMISLPDTLLKEIDEAAKATHRKRSEFFKELALDFLGHHRRRIHEFADLEHATMSGFDFWNNAMDDETWNAPEST